MHRHTDIYKHRHTKEHTLHTNKTIHTLSLRHIHINTHTPTHTSPPPPADSRPLRGVIIMGCCWQEGRRLLAKREEKTVKNVQLESEHKYKTLA